MFSKESACLIFLFCLPLISGTSIVREEIECVEKCDRDGWKCSLQDVNALNEQLQTALGSIKIPYKDQYPPKPKDGEPKKQMGFGITIKYQVASLDASVTSKVNDSILLQWNREGNKIKSGSICMTDVDAKFSVEFGVAIDLFTELTLFRGTISMKVEDFSALLEMSSKDDKLIKDKCKTNPPVLEIKAKNYARKLPPFLRAMMKNLGGMGSSLFGDAFGGMIPNIPSDLMEPMVSLLTGDKATPINVCKIIDTVFNMFDNESLDGVASFFEQQVNTLLDDLEEENDANSLFIE